MCAIRRSTLAGVKPLPAKYESQPAIEDNALIGDLHTAALVAKDGSIDFLCLPDFDSDTCFASILGTPENGYWRIAPTRGVDSVQRHYRGHTLILETEFTNELGLVRVTDFMPVRQQVPRVVRIVEALRGEVTMTFDLRPRFAYGLTVPREILRRGVTSAIAGPDALYLRGGGGPKAPPFNSEDTLKAGERVAFELSWARPYDAVPPPLDIDAALEETEAFWNEWTSRIRLPSDYQDVVMRSLITLRACTYRPNGAIVAAPTFGLPESPGGERNWDYRFTWVRDSILAISALMSSGLIAEVQEFARWFLDAVGGAPGQFQIMYGIRGERILTENTLPWLCGHGGAKPVRIGNAAYSQFQLDVLGELAAVIYAFAQLQGRLDDEDCEIMKSAAAVVASSWTTKDHGIWEMRGPVQAFTASKVAAWTTIDRWLRLIDLLDLKEDKAPWEALREKIRADVVANGFNAKRSSFSQYYGSDNVDASLLFIPLSGFLPATDPRVIGTVKAIEDDLMQDGLVLRYRTEASPDGLTGEEGVFLACSFWLASTYQMMGRHDDARALFLRVAGLRNDVGLLAEEYLTREKRQTGNFPQAFSHLALVNAAYMLADGHPPPI
jgi:GH15 family glucan-1,4-alpha-glucosidase